MTHDLASAPATQVAVLPNGLTVLVHEDQRFPLVSVRLFVRAGSAHELPEQAGISHLLEHMVFKGANGSDPGMNKLIGQAAARIEGIGGELNAATGFDATTYLMDVPDEHWVLALEVLQEMIFDAAVDPGELESERQVILSELAQGKDQPQRRLFETVQSLVWAGLPYERPIIGFEQTVQSIRREDILHYIQDRYQPGNMLLVVCGNVRQQDVVIQAQRVFGNLVNQSIVQAPGPLPTGLAHRSPRLVVEQGPWRKAHFAMALPIPGLGSVQGVGLDVLAQMLGGDRTSLLYRTFKHEQGLVDAVSASATSLELAGVFFIQAQLDPENVPRFWNGLVSLLADLKADSFAPEALDRAKLNLEDSLFQAKETLSGIASKLGYFQFHEQSVAAEQRYLYLVRHMNREQVAALIKEHLRPEELVTVVYTPRPEDLDAKDMLAGLDRSWTRATVNDAGVDDTGLPAAVQGVAAKQGQPRREIIHLAPGRTLVLLPDASLPYTALHMSWAGGDLLLAPEEQGLAELTSRVWTKGTRAKSAVQIQDFLADRAAQAAAGAGQEQLALSAYYPSRFGKDMAAFFLELIQSPSWAPEELDRAKKEQLAAIVRAEDHPVGLAFRRLFPFLFPDHPYGYQRAGDPIKVSAYTREQVSAFWERQVQKPWVLCVSGDFDRGEMLGLAERIAEHGSRLAADPPAPVWTRDTTLTLNLAERNQAHLLAVFPAPGLAHADSAGLRMLREVLAGQSGMLFQDLRDAQGLAYAVSAFLWQNTLTGFLSLYIATAPSRVDQALAGFQAAVQRLSQNSLEAAELTRAGNLLWGDYHRGRQPLMARALEASEALSRGLDPDHHLHVLEQARRLTPGDISALVEKYLHWDRAYFVKVLP